MQKGLSLIVGLLLVVAVAASPSLFRPHRRFGNVYRDAVEKEKRHHAKLGYTPNTTKNFFQQLIDHDNPSLGTFPDKFYYDMTFYNGSGPCMMYLNGEGPLSSSVGGYMIEIAQQLGACALSIEHRWYGESLPGPMTNKALLTKTLTVDQALRDVMALIKYFESTILKKQVKWILVGGSYSGACTVWLNEKYPGFFKASWASSGVVRSTFAYTDYDGHVLTVTPGDCRDALTRVMRVAETKWQKSAQDEARLRTMFNIPSYNTKLDFLWAMADISASSVQYSAKTRMCDGIVPLPVDDWDALEKYRDVLFAMWGSNFMASCYYSTECLSNPAMANKWGPDGYSWVYQCCSEVAWWQIGYQGSVRSPNITTSYFMDQCRSAFYNDTMPDTWAFNKKWHGYTPITQGNIIATQGSDDPWSTTGLRVSIAPNFPVHVAQCTNCGHCADMHAPSDSDPQPLKEQRQLVLQYLTQWISQ